VNAAKTVYEPPAMVEVGEFTDLTRMVVVGYWWDLVILWTP
jgi:hypothetical protein